MNIFLGLGTNLGEREQNLIEAKDLLMKHNVLVMGQSDVLETQPLGGKDQPLYLNQVVECQTDLTPQDLLLACKRVEIEMGREGVVMPGFVGIGGGFGSSIGASALASGKSDEKWESRIIDIDILFYEDQVVDELTLKIPHEGLESRDFVLKGMCDLDSEFQHPVLRKTMRDLLNLM
jgi:7,8-dihydro-6-hydroxymethylpterin-pyrophosphokinase